MNRAMTRAIALSLAAPHLRMEWLRSLVVSGCALALIMARTALPF